MVHFTVSEKIMNREQTIEALRKIGLEGNFQRTKHNDFGRIFVIDEHGVTLGRITMYQGCYDHIKWYFRFYGELCESDFIAARWSYLLGTGGVLSREAWNAAITEAEEYRKKDYEEKAQWRRDNPLPGGKSRKKLRGRSVRGLIKLEG